jgi:hypothetical protein
MMMGLGIQVEIGVSGLAVHFVQEWEVAFTFGFHGELNGLMDDVQVV